MCTSFVIVDAVVIIKIRTNFFSKNKVQKKRSKPENRILISGIQLLMESGIHGCGIRNPQTWNPESTAWNPESRTLLDYLTWGNQLQVRALCLASLSAKK